MSHGSLWVLLWLLNVVLDSCGQLAFKAAASDPDTGDGLVRWKNMLSRPWLWIGIISYVVEFLVWVAFLSLVPLSLGVLLGSINIVGIMILGRILFKEHLTPMRVIGILLITAGVAVVSIQT